MSVDFGWRRFNFFDKSIVQDPENPNEKFLGLKVSDSRLQTRRLTTTQREKAVTGAVASYSLSTTLLDAL